jgi:hypothetical protein
MAQPYIGPNGNTQYREATGNGSLATPYIPAFTVANNLVVSNPKYFSEVTVTKPATTTAYDINKVYGNLFQIPDIGNSGGIIELTSVSIVFDLATLPTGMSDFALYLFNSSPATTFANNELFSVPTNNRASLLTLNGINLTANLARGGGTVVAETILINSTFKLANASASLWGYLVSLSTFSHNVSSSFIIRLYAK